MKKVLFTCFFILSVVLNLYFIVEGSEKEVIPYTMNHTYNQDEIVRIPKSSILVDKVTGNSSFDQYISDIGDGYVDYVLPVGEYYHLKREDRNGRELFSIIHIHIRNK